MWVRLDSASTVPVFQQLAEQIRAAIRRRLEAVIAEGRRAGLTPTELEALCREALEGKP